MYEGRVVSHERWFDRRVDSPDQPNSNIRSNKSDANVSKIYLKVRGIIIIIAYIIWSHNTSYFYANNKQLPVSVVMYHSGIKTNTYGPFIRTEICIYCKFVLLEHYTQAMCTYMHTHFLNTLVCFCYFSLHNKTNISV